MSKMSDILLVRSRKERGHPGACDMCEEWPNAQTFLLILTFVVSIQWQTYIYNPLPRFCFTVSFYLIEKKLTCIFHGIWQ